MKAINTPVIKKRGRPPGPNNRVGEGRNHSLTRALTLLERLSETAGGMHLTELSQQMGMPPATTHRILNTFEELGFVEQDPELGLWFIGLKAFTVGKAFLNRRDFISTARPYMRQLVEECGETVNLGIIDDGEVVYVNQVQSAEMMRMVVELGSRSPIHASGVGKAVLACLSEAAVTSILQQRGLARFTDKTLVKPADLRAEMGRIRRQGYALDDEEHAIGLRCVAATIFDEFGGAMAGISLSGPKARIVDSRLTDLGAATRQTADAITAALGGHKPRGAL